MASDAATDNFDFEVMKERVEMGLSERHDKGWLLKHNIIKGGRQKRAGGWGPGRGRGRGRGEERGRGRGRGRGEGQGEGRGGDGGGGYRLCGDASRWPGLRLTVEVGCAGCGAETTAAPLQATKQRIEFKIKQRSLVGKLSARPSVDDLIDMHIMEADPGPGGL